MTARKSLIVCAALALVGAMVAPVERASAVEVTAYTDVSITGASATHVTGVNTAGTISGYYLGGKKGTTVEGFIMTGGVTSVTTVVVATATGTRVNAINDSGTSVGSYVDRKGNEHGFIRTASGAVTVLDDPSLVTKGVHSYGTVATGINSSGVVVGYYYTTGPDKVDSHTYVTHNHGFTRSSAGTFTTYDAPDAADSALPSVGTRLFGINDVGDKVGAYTYNVGPELGPDTRNSGFEVTAGGTFTEIVHPTSTLNACFWTEPHGINDAGLIVGDAGNGCAGTSFGWLLSGGTFTNLVYTDESGEAQYTLANSVNNAGVIGGTWGSGIGETHGYTATIG